MILSSFKLGYHNSTHTLRAIRNFRHKSAHEMNYRITKRPTYSDSVRRKTLQREQKTTQKQKQKRSQKVTPLSIKESTKYANIKTSNKKEEERRLRAFRNHPPKSFLEKFERAQNQRYISLHILLMII